MVYPLGLDIGRDEKNQMSDIYTSKPIPNDDFSLNGQNPTNRVQVGHSTQISFTSLIQRSFYIRFHLTFKKSCYHLKYKLKRSLNKRAQRALGRSPEEKVKGHSGANNREPQGHNLNNFGRGPIDDAIY